MSKEKISQNSNDENAVLSMRERVGYGIGDFANNMMYAPVASFVTYFLTNISGISAGVVGTMMLLSRLLDGFSDLTVGVLMEKVKSPKGKARPWLLWWCIPFAVSLVLMFTAPDFGMTGKIVYAFLTYNLATTVVYTAINLPFGSLATLMTRNQKERGYLNISKMVFAFAGGLVVNTCTLPLVKYFGNDARAWQLTFVIYGIVATVIFIVVYFSTKERVGGSVEEREAEKVDMKQAIKVMFHNKYWLLMLAIFFLNQLGQALIGVNVYYAQYIMNDTGLVGSLSVFQTIASFITFGVSAILISKFGKQKIALAGAVISAVGYGLVILAPESYTMLYATALIKGAGNAAISGVMYGMLADTIEYNEWKFGIRTEGLLFSANSIGIKVGTGVGSALLGWILAGFGFISSSATQPAMALTGIRVIFLYVPVVVYIVLALIITRYKLDKEYDGIIADLEARKAAAK